MKDTNSKSNSDNVLNELNFFWSLNEVFTLKGVEVVRCRPAIPPIQLKSFNVHPLAWHNQQRVDSLLTFKGWDLVNSWTNRLQRSGFISQSWLPISVPCVIHVSPLCLFPVWTQKIYKTAQLLKNNKMKQYTVQI